jgi:hypothetical protein
MGNEDGSRILLPLALGMLPRSAQIGMMLFRIGRYPPGAGARGGLRVDFPIR